MNQRSPTPASRTLRGRSARAGQSGVGLIEVMVAVLVLSIGFLGVGALLAMSLSTNNSAMSRSMATMDSYSILDAMRADITNAKSGSYNTATPLKASSCPAAGGTMASVQLNKWCQQLQGINGAVATTTGAVSCNTQGECTITIQFDDSRAGTDSGGSKTQQVITKAIL